ncbi:hypothetical protein [Actinoplanes awajinensis]|uniref:Uncharacterized protein n=1 Tax=Actinoplanes awajinensis subsp. mycoplanecinus TaxID=135947 RepID=A0A101JKV4_9ACTN|nr:hypothetical protein [Actinoplanes awajinensis]KUL28763.1 hypothetical protein ADL15_30940 [Actinoplanes awajinensis subsp. mycoplanecinus]
MTVHDLAAALPGIPSLRDRCRALAMVEAILNPDRETRYYAFDAHWAPDQELASMHNGAGDAWSIVFTPAGAFLRGFDHESPMNTTGDSFDPWPGLLTGLPEVFAAQVTEPAFLIDGTLAATLCLWRRPDDDRWRAGQIDFPDGDDPDGAGWLFHVLLQGTPAAYQDFAEAYYETTVHLDAVTSVFAHHPLSEDLIHRLNPDLTLRNLAADAAEIGYPAPA